MNKGARDLSVQPLDLSKITPALKNVSASRVSHNNARPPSGEQPLDLSTKKRPLASGNKEGSESRNSDAPVAKKLCPPGPAAQYRGNPYLTPCAACRAARAKYCPHNAGGDGVRAKQTSKDVYPKPAHQNLNVNPPHAGVHLNAVPSHLNTTNPSESNLNRSHSGSPLGGPRIDIAKQYATANSAVTDTLPQPPRTGRGSPIELPKQPMTQAIKEHEQHGIVNHRGRAFIVSPVRPQIKGQPVEVTKSGSNTSISSHTSISSVRSVSSQNSGSPHGVSGSRSVSDNMGSTDTSKKGDKCEVLTNSDKMHVKSVHELAPDVTSQTMEIKAFAAQENPKATEGMKVSPKTCSKPTPLGDSNQQCPVAQTPVLDPSGIPNALLNVPNYTPAIPKDKTKKMRRSSSHSDKSERKEKSRKLKKSNSERILVPSRSESGSPATPTARSPGLGGAAMRLPKEIMVARKSTRPHKPSKKLIEHVETEGVLDENGSPPKLSPPKTDCMNPNRTPDNAVLSGDQSTPEMPALSPYTPAKKTQVATNTSPSPPGGSINKVLFSQGCIERPGTPRRLQTLIHSFDSASPRERGSSPDLPLTKARSMPDVTPKHKTVPKKFTRSPLAQKGRIDLSKLSGPTKDKSSKNSDNSPSELEAVAKNKNKTKHLNAFMSTTPAAVKAMGPLDLGTLRTSPDNMFYPPQCTSRRRRSEGDVSNTSYYQSSVLHQQTEQESQQYSENEYRSVILINSLINKFLINFCFPIGPEIAW